MARLPPIAGGSTRSDIFAALRDRGSASRAELAKITGLSAPTVGKVADELLSLRLIEEHDDAAAPSSIGRPSRPLRLNATDARIVTLQIGVRHTRIATLPVAGPADDAWPAQFETPQRIVTFLDRLRAARRSVPRPLAIAVSAPGVIDEPAGSVLLCPNLHWLQGVDLPGVVRGIWPGPICVVQEIRALALGQLTADPTVRDFVLVDFGEGVGGAVVTGGELFHTPLPLAGELGHSRVPGNTRACGCGATGCLETLVSRRGLVESLLGAHRGARASWPGLVAHVTAQGLEPWLADTLDAAGAVIGSALNLVGVRHVVITGALAELPPIVIDRLAQSIRASAMWARFGEVIVTAGPRRRAAGLVRAAVDRVILPSIDATARAPQLTVPLTGASR